MPRRNSLLNLFSAFLRQETKCYSCLKCFSIKLICDSLRVHLSLLYYYSSFVFSFFSFSSFSLCYFSLFVLPSSTSSSGHVSVACMDHGITTFVVCPCTFTNPRLIWVIVFYFHCITCFLLDLSSNILVILFFTLFSFVCLSVVLVSSVF